MDENSARDVVLVRAVETTDHERALLSDEDRQHATRSAEALAQSDASDRKSAVTPDLFLRRRAEQVLKKLVQRHPGFSTAVARRSWVSVLGIGVPGAAFLSGILADRIGDPHRVDLLSAPLLLIIGWNLAVYVAALVWLLVAAFRSPRARSGVSKWLTSASVPAPGGVPRVLVAAWARFSVEWAQLSAPLILARGQRMVHLSAALLALGAALSLYIRGFVVQYRAGWESTFLDAQQVHALLSVLFAPAGFVFALPGFTVSQIRTLEFTQTASPGGGALWVYLYGGTLLLLVVLPRLVLAYMARRREKTLAACFPLDLGQAYFRKLIRTIDPAAPALLRVCPYSFTLDETRGLNLQVVARMLLGARARVMLRPSTAYGEDPQQGSQGTLAGPVENARTVALFNLSATPERENHGAFLDHLCRGAAHGIAALVDESGYLERLATQAGAEARLHERMALWRQFCELHGVYACMVNLVDPNARKDEIEPGLPDPGPAP